MPTETIEQQAALIFAQVAAGDYRGILQALHNAAPSEAITEAIESIEASIRDLGRAAAPGPTAAPAHWLQPV